MKNLMLPLLALALLSACQSETIRPLADGVMVSIAHPQEGGARWVRLQVRGDKLIKVSATPEKQFRNSESLIILPQQEVTPHAVTQRGDTVTLATASIRANVLATTGEVWFTDSLDQIILSELQGGGKTFIPIAVEGTKGYSILQRFQSPADEAFYGLGQHQSDEFNYKGKSEELFQYNTKISIPFVVSNKQYGLLFDSYSLCRFGNPDDYLQLDQLFTLYDKEGQKGALTGTYTPRTGEVVTRREERLYFENLKALQQLPEAFPLMGATVCFEGEIEPAVSGEFPLILYYAGYVKVYIDGQNVVPERWRTAWNPNSYKFSVRLTAQQRVPIRVEWIPDGGESYCGLRGYLPLDEEVKNQHTWWSEMTPQLEYYFLYGESMDEVISGYRTLTGKAQIMPKWAMGFWQSRERYKTQEEILGALDEFRSRKLPLDNIVLDWSYWPEAEWGSHAFDEARFPDPKGMVDSIHARNAKLMISVWPKFYTTTDHYKAFDERGWIYPLAVTDSLRDWIGRGYHYAFYDAYSKEARTLFWQQMKETLYPLGIDAWWMDASEPNIRDCTDIDYRKALCGPTALGSSTQFFNAYSLMNAEAIYEGQRAADNDKRVFLLTRSGFAGLQRYATAAWSGDIGTRWEDLKAQISAGLNFALSGIPYWTMDIGGFCVESRYERAQRQWERAATESDDLKEWRELNARWYQFGAFVPLYRAHGQFPFREIWHIAPEGHPAYRTIEYYTRLRYRLMPYLYSLAAKTHFDDYTLMRPLVMDFPHDPAVVNLGDQYLFGPSLLVAPVYKQGATSRPLYLPSQTGWYNFYDGTFLAGGATYTAEAPYERMPLFVKAGAILPIGPEIEYTDQVAAHEIKLFVYRGADGHFTLYEDEGDNYNYEKGAYSTIPIAYDEDTQTLTIGSRQGFFEGMLTERTFTVVYCSPDTPQPYNPEEKGIIVTYSGEEVVVTF